MCIRHSIIDCFSDEQMNTPGVNKISHRGVLNLLAPHLKSSEVFQTVTNLGFEYCTAASDHSTTVPVRHISTSGLNGQNSSRFQFVSLSLYRMLHECGES